MNKIIIKHIIEIKLFKRMFSFSNFHGELTDFFIKNLGVDKIRSVVDGSRIDVATNDLKKVFFASYENFGLQIEGANSFDEPVSEVNRFLESLKSFGKYEFDSVNRIGTKSLVFCHIKGKNLDDIKEIYRKNIFINQKIMEEKINAELYDFAYSFDIKNEHGIANIQTGPATKEEAIKKFFGGNNCYEEFSKGSGLFFSIDFGKNEKKDNMLMDSLKEEVADSFENIEKIFNGFLNYFEINEDGK
ncbi:MAG: hypothetical protein YFSK_1950 [Candidatus Yanofskyibacterium parasiticum]|nr:MAG: hypothetical protein YFSK_1950 [Candidatus Yanofskybacteria bacterium]